jgi:hypothetical protein
MMNISVKDNPSLVRDTNTMAILAANRDVVSINQKRSRDVAEKQQQKEEINTLKKDVGEIKDMLQKILERM